MRVSLNGQNQRYYLNNNAVNFNPDYHTSNFSVSKSQDKPFGFTALEISRKSVENLQKKRDLQLFSMLHHKVKDEYLKYKTFLKFERKQKNIDDYLDALYYKRWNDFNERQIRNNDRLLSHDNLYEMQKNNYRNKIIKYKINCEEKEKRFNERKLKRAEELQRKKEENEEKMQENEYRLNNIVLEDKKRRNSIDKLMQKKGKEREEKLENKKNQHLLEIQKKNIVKQEQLNQNLDILLKKRIEFNNKVLLKHNREEEQVLVLKLKKNDENNEKIQMNLEKQDMHKNLYNSCILAQTQFKEKVKNKIKERHRSARKIKENIDLKNDRKFKDNQESEILKHIKIDQMKEEDRQKRDDKRKEMDDKMKKIDSFINERGLLNQRRKDIDNEFSHDLVYFSNEIQNLMYRRQMDNKALNNVKNMVITNPKLADITNGIE